MAINKKILESFNNIKNRIYKNQNFSSRYEFEEFVEIFTHENWNEDDLEALQALKNYVNNIKNSVEDLGSKIVDLTLLDFSNKVRLEEFAKKIIVIIDEYIDALVAITNIVEFDENRINIQLSLARLKSLRNSLIKKINEYCRMTTGITFKDDQAQFMKVLISDIIDSIIKESFLLRIQKLSEILNEKF